MNQINDTTKRFPRSMNEARPWEHPVIEHYKDEHYKDEYSKDEHWHLSSWFAAACFIAAVCVMVAVGLEWI